MQGTAALSLVLDMAHAPMSAKLKWVAAFGAKASCSSSRSEELRSTQPHAHRPGGARSGVVMPRKVMRAIERPSTLPQWAPSQAQTLT